MPSLRALRRCIYDWCLEHGWKRKTCREASEASIVNSDGALPNLPREIRSLILDAWLRLHAPEIIGKDGRIQHPLVDDTWKKLDEEAFLNLFHATPLVVKEYLGVNKVQSRAPLVDWLENTPQFLTLCDHRCGKLARKKIRFNVCFTITTRVDCTHQRIVIEASWEEEDWIWTATCYGGPTDGSACPGRCAHYAIAIWQMWTEDFMQREGLPVTNARFEITFVGEARIAKGMRWAKENPWMALVNVLGWTGLGIILPVILVAVLLYVIPFWMVWSAKLMLVSSKKHWLKTRIRFERTKRVIKRIRSCRVPYP